MEEVTVERLRRVCLPDAFDFATTASLEPLRSLVGQDRAIRSLELGLHIGHPGFNTFVMGPPGTGKAHAVESYLRIRAETRPLPGDWCYVNNFEDPYRPMALYLPPGRAVAFRQAMHVLMSKVVHVIPKAFESDEYIARRDKVARAAQARQREIVHELEEKARPLQFAVQFTKVGLLLAPMMNGTPLNEEEFLKLEPDAHQAIQRTRAALEGEVRQFMKRAHDIDRLAEERLQTLDREIANSAAGALFSEIQETLADSPPALSWLRSAEEYLLANLHELLPSPQSSAAQPNQDPSPLALRRYDVNVLVDNGQSHGAPVIIENNPTYPNLFGRLQQEFFMGAVVADFTLLKAGALHRANGGYLVIPVDELLRNEGSYDGLKRALRNRRLSIEDLADRVGLASSKTVQPQPIPLAVKVVLLGAARHYYFLHAEDEQFRELFKVRADFDNRMEWTPEGVQSYARFIRTQCAKEDLRALERGAVAKLVEIGARLAEDQTKLTTQFGDLADTLREADHWASLERAPIILERHVRQAVESRLYRSGLAEERLRELITSGVIHVETGGAVVGQVNGLAVTSVADHSFGIPCRITATVGIGQAGLLDIEREAQLSGASHTKGVLVLSGYLESEFAQDKPLCLSARLTFEQLHNPVDGDSASSAELFALLSALSGLPIKQSIAVTGAVDQHGHVQAIGGINQKVEGFFDVCRVKGLTGCQGVLIPKSNVVNLMLREDVADAVAEGMFHIWAIEHVNEGIEMLTGVSAGHRGEDGHFPAGSVNRLVDQRILDMAQTMRLFYTDGVASALVKG